MNAIADAGLTGKILVVGISLAAESYERLKRGEMYASVLESPLESAHSMIDTAIDIANGKTAPETVYIELGPVTRENIDSIEKPTW
jgi:ribose transport system substrate-binding protein